MSMPISPANKHLASLATRTRTRTRKTTKNNGEHHTMTQPSLEERNLLVTAWSP
jgi:hypothetical protein